MFKSIIIQIILIISINCLVINIGYGQTDDDFRVVSQFNKPHEHTHAYYWEYAQKDNTSELDLVFSGLFLFYKEFVSSQDASSCSFTPSCSEYALLAIKKQGVIVGGINFFDRFSRCNGLSPEHYHRHPKTHLLDDPVE